MYAGHSAVALALKGRNPEVALLPLVFACFGPDWVDLVLMVLAPFDSTELYSHSIPAVVVGAAMAAGLMTLFGMPGARTVFVGWLLHWPADLFTGLKPLFAAAPLVGLDLYHRPRADFLLESAIVFVGTAIYLRAFPRTRTRSAIVMATAAMLVATQAAVDYTIVRTDRSRWQPSLATPR